MGVYAKERLVVWDKIYRMYKEMLHQVIDESVMVGKKQRSNWLIRVQKPIWLSRLIVEASSVVRLDRTDFSLNPSGTEVTGIGQLWDTWSSCLICCRPWRSSRGRAYLRLHSSERSSVKRRCALSRCGGPGVGSVRQDAEQNQHFSYEDLYLMMNKVMKNSSTMLWWYPQRYHH